MNIVTRPYESLLPFLVVEAISAQNISFNSMSVRMIDEGWAWLVGGRKLLIWKFKDSKAPGGINTRRMLSPCFELQLPQSDLVHKAELVQVFFMPQDPNTSSRAITVPAALVVSPEGTIRFWSNITNERFTESSVADLQGQEFCTLASLSPLEYFIGTTTGSVFLLTIDNKAYDARNTLICSSLNAPSGLLSGFGRRVTNLFFGPMTADVGTDSRRPLITVPKYSQATIDKTGSTDRPFFVMSSTFKLRQWSRTNEGLNSTNQVIREWDLQRAILTRLISEMDMSEEESLSFWPIDMITTKSKELLMLIVTLDTARQNAINYAICIFNPYQVHETITSLTILTSHTWHYSNETEDQLLALRFLERRATSPLCFMYDRKFLFLVRIDQGILDAIDYANQDDGVLGAGLVDGHPILFTQRDGLTYVVPVACDISRMNETSIQLEPPQSTVNDTSRQQRNTSTRVDPMIVEIDVEEDTENERPSRHIYNRDTSTMSKSVLDQSMLNKPSDHIEILKADDFNAFIEENKEFEWVQQIDNKQYGLASETLARVAEESETLKERKETLLALSKLAKLAE